MTTARGESCAIVEVIWVDSEYPESGWHCRDTVDEFLGDGLERYASAGYLLAEDEGTITLGLNTSSSGGVAGMMKIPRVAITDIRYLRTAPE